MGGSVATSVATAATTSTDGSNVDAVLLFEALRKNPFVVGDVVRLHRNSDKGNAEVIAVFRHNSSCKIMFERGVEVTAPQRGLALVKLANLFFYQHWSSEDSIDPKAFVSER